MENYRVTDIGAKQMSKEDKFKDIWFAVKATITNLTDNEIIVSVDVQGVDIDDFEVTSVSLSNTLSPGELKILTNRSYISSNEWEMIKRWQVGRTQVRVQNDLSREAAGRG